MTTPALNDDLVRRLRALKVWDDHRSNAPLGELAAGTLETLAAENAALRSALEPFARLIASLDAHGVAFLRSQPNAGDLSDEDLARLFSPDDQVCLTDGSLNNPERVTWGDLRRARTTLTGAR